MKIVTTVTCLVLINALEGHFEGHFDILKLLLGKPGDCTFSPDLLFDRKKCETNANYCVQQSSTVGNYSDPMDSQRKNDFFMSAESCIKDHLAKFFCQQLSSRLMGKIVKVMYSKGIGQSWPFARLFKLQSYNLQITGRLGCLMKLTIT